MIRALVCWFLERFPDPAERTADVVYIDDRRPSRPVAHPSTLRRPDPEAS